MAVESAPSISRRGIKAGLLIALLFFAIGTIYVLTHPNLETWKQQAREAIAQQNYAEALRDSQERSSSTQAIRKPLFSPGRLPRI